MTIRSETAPSAITPTARTSARLAWVDATRGYCVAAVVLFHLVLWHYGVGGADIQPAAAGFWAFVNSTLGSVRMPVLLGVSGLVLSRQIGAGLHRATTGFRVLNNYYLYFVWLSVYALFYLGVQQRYLPHRVDGWGVVGQLFVPGTTLWYLFAIALFTVIMAAARRAPAWLVLSLLFVLSTYMHSQRVQGAAIWMKIPELFIFFAIGVYGAGWIRALARGATFPRLGLALGVAIGVTALGRFATDRYSDAALFVVRGTAFMVLCVLAVSIVVRWDPLLRLGVALGRRTLVVYVMHPLWIALLTLLVLGPARSEVDSALATPLAFFYPLIATAGIILASIGFQFIAERVRLQFLFEMPLRWRAKLGRP